jgi:cytoskeletal protein CcmA (bactofilin family)
MLGKGKQESTSHRDIRAFLEAGCELEGKLAFSGVVRLNGRVKGDITTEDVLIVGNTAEIEGTIQVGEIVIGGRIAGNVRARHRIEVLASGSVEGTLAAPLLVTHEGAQLVGKVEITHTLQEPQA